MLKRPASFHKEGVLQGSLQQIEDQRRCSNWLQSIISTSYTRMGGRVLLLLLLRFSRGTTREAQMAREPKAPTHLLEAIYDRGAHTWLHKRSTHVVPAAARQEEPCRQNVPPERQSSSFASSCSYHYSGTICRRRLLRFLDQLATVNSRHRHCVGKFDDKPMKTSKTSAPNESTIPVRTAQQTSPS